MIAFVVAGAILAGGHEVARGVQPAWSPDGKRVAYVRDGDIWVGGRRLTRTAAEEGTPAWSPDGRRLAFVRRGVDFDLYVMRADGRRVQRIVSNAVEPAWSPDGRWIVFASNHFADNQELWVVHPNGTGLRRLTHRADDDAWPTYSPDGRTIAYTHAGAIWTMRADGSRPRLLVDVRGRDDWNPAYSPDGRTLVFTSLRLRTSWVYTVARDGTRLRRLGAGGDATFKP